MADQPFLRIRDLRKSFDSLHVLQGVDVDIDRGEKLAILGPSGSGKSTLLKVLMTLEQPDDGVIEIEGESVWTVQRNGRHEPADEGHLRQVRQKVGMVFQHFNLFPHMTALRNVALAPEIVLGLDRKEAEGRARELLETVGVQDKADSYPAELSGGQKQRVAIARALAMEPKIMLFDEITSALDPELVEEVLGVLRRLAHETEMTMLIITHEIHFAQEIADRVLFFDEGRIVEEGPPEKMFSKPEHPRAREFFQQVLEH